MKILCSDYDGTLSQKMHISHSTSQAIKEFQKQGNLFGVVTGRGYAVLINNLRKADINPDFLILGNGALVLVNEKSIVTNKFSHELLQGIYDVVNKNRMSTFTISDGMAFEQLKTKRRFSLYDPIMRLISLFYYGKQEPVNHDELIVCYAKDLNRRVTKRVAKELKDTFGDEIEAKVNVGINIDITAKGVTKEKAIEILEDEFPSSLIYTIGDGYNDVGMLKKYYGFAIASGKKEAKQVAKKIVRNVEEAITEIMEDRQ